MTREQCEQNFERFREDVKDHRVTVLREDGLYRHLRCSRGGYAYQFDVVTWPGYLAYTGDMGSFVFSRLPDMFEFFRGRREALVDLGYLAEKAVAADKPDGIRRYSEDRFREAVLADFAEFVDGHALTKGEADGLWQQIEDEVLSCGDNSHDAHSAAGRFRWEPDEPHKAQRQEVFPDFWEKRLEEYTTRFWWCCYAVPWAIEQYDRAKEATT